MNRILAGIERAKAAIQAKNLSPEKVEEASKSMDMSFSEYCRFQTLKSAAMGTTLTLDEAQSIYYLLGETVEHFNSQPLEVKWTLTSVFASLLLMEYEIPISSSSVYHVFRRGIFDGLFGIFALL